MTDRNLRQHWGRRLAIIRRQRGITQTALSAMTGISTQQLHATERVGRANLTDERLATICAALGVTVADVTADEWKKLCGVTK